MSDKPREKLYSPPVSPVGGLINDYIIYFFFAINMRDIIGHFCKTQPKLVLYFIYTYFYTSPWSERNQQCSLFIVQLQLLFMCCIGTCIGSPAFISDIFFTNTILVKTLISCTLQNISLYNLFIIHSRVIKNLI